MDTRTTLRVDAGLYIGIPVCPLIYLLTVTHVLRPGSSASSALPFYPLADFAVNKGPGNPDVERAKFWQLPTIGILGEACLTERPAVLAWEPDNIAFGLRRFSLQLRSVWNVASKRCMPQEDIPLVCAAFKAGSSSLPPSTVSFFVKQHELTLLILIVTHSPALRIPESRYRLKESGSIQTRSASL